MAKRNPKPQRKAVIWRVRVLMAMNNIRTVTDLAQRLEADAGVSISNAQLARLIDGKSSHWSQDIIEGLMTVFNCPIGELWKEAAQ